MAQIVKVVGLIRTQESRPPNGVECDGCGRTELFERYAATNTLRALRAVGWIIAQRESDLEAPAFCPACRPPSNADGLAHEG